MNVSFVNYDPFEQPVLVLKTAHGDTIGVIGSAENVGIDINYNEVSTIEFDITDRINGEVMPYYDQVVGMRIVELVDIGQFILINPDEVDTGELRRKKCKCNSLEYEFTYKKITLPENTYRLWDPSGKEITVVSMIMEQMPSWRVEFVSESLQYAYRTFSVSNDNLYNFIKGTVQRSFGCVFEFDTFNRIVRIIDVNVDAETRPVLISHENLAKEIDIKENTDNLFTRLDVNGADGVDIRSVNPAGTNKLINLDYFMTKDNFSTALINKYNQWKQSWKNNITPYRYLTIRHSAAIMQKITEQSALLDLKNELTDIENEQAVIIQAIASGLKTQADLNDVNVRVRRKKEEIAAKENEIKNIERQIEDIISEMKAVQNQCSFESHFTADEMAILTPYIRDGEVSESSFVVTDNAAYTDAGGGKWVGSLVVSITGSATKMTSSTSVSEIYDIRGGNVSVGNSVTGSVVSAIADIKADGSAVMSIRVGSGLADGNEFDGASITIVGSLHSNTNDAAQNGDTGDYEISDIKFVIRDAYEYFTLDVSEYDKRSVSQDLMEYGIDVLERLAWPKYSFNVSLANFFAIKDFVDFKNQLRLGVKIDLVAGEDKALSPICTGISMNYNNPSSLTMRFGDTYSANDSKFSLLDLLEKSVSMGKNVDVGKFNYSSFVNSGAKTNIKKFMESALDVAKNAILSSGRQAITWDGAGFRLRKWANESKTAYDDEQIWMNNNSIMLTDDNWNTAKMAIGKFKDANIGDCWGVVAPMIVGTLIAGSELIIESAKKDGETSVFRMDSDGCRLYNSQMDIHNEAAHITLNPDTGIAIGQYPVCDPETKKVNENNANFWVDSNGNVHMRGTLHGANGEFTGRITATELIIQSGNNKSQTIKEYVDDNVQIGGRNYVLDTAEPYTVTGTGSKLVLHGWKCASKEVLQGLFGKEVTVSFDYEENITSGAFNMLTGYTYQGIKIFDSNSGSGHLTKTFTLNNGTAGGDVILYIDGTWTGSVTFRNVKLELGNKETDWSPAPEDADAAIATVSAELLVQKDQISSKVGRTEFDTLGQMVAKHESSITQTPEQIRLAVENVQIGGRNYILGTAEPYTAVGTGSRQWLYPWKCASIAANRSLYGKTVTISFDYEEAITSGSLGVIVNDLWIGVKSFDSDTGSGHFTLTREHADFNTGSDVFIYIDGTWTGSVTFSKVKVEIGSKETDWTPAPEDTDAAIAELSAAISIQAGEIISNATKIETVSQAAGNAQSSANAAQNTANAAQDAANSAQTAAGNAQITANDAKNQANTNKNSLSDVSKRVVTVENSVSALDEAIKFKVSTDTFNAFDQTVSKNFSEVTQTATNINNRVTDEVKGLQAQINTNAEGILLQAGKKSGGTQLLKNGGFYGGLSNWSKLEYNVNGEWRNLYVEAPTPDNQYRSQEAPNLILHAQYETGMFGAAQVVKGLRKNTQYTISGYVASHRCNRAGIEIRDTTASRWAMNPVFDVGWGGTNLSAYNRFEYTFDTGDYTDYQITLYGNNFQDNAYVWWAQVKLEEGNTATAWSSHPEEFRSGSNVTITSEEVDITTPKFEVNILSDDGSTNALTINESGAVFQSVIAPNVAPRYDGPAMLYVNPNATSAQIAKGDTFRSLADALAKLSGKWVGYNVTINLAAGMTEYGSLSLVGVSGGWWITIQGNSSNPAKLVGGLYAYHGSSPVSVKYLNIDATGDRGIHAEGGGQMVKVDNCVITGKGNAGTYGICSYRGAYVEVENCEVYDFARSLYGQNCGLLAGYNCKGNNQVGANHSTIYLRGTMPCDSPTWAYAASWAGQVIATSITVDQGSKPTPIPAPTTVTYNYTSSDSYRGGWSYFDTDAPRQGFNGMDIYGVVWFDAAAIRSALSGKTIKQASLRLFMAKGVGRGRSVVVQLYGTNMGYDGRSGRPELTTSYGTIGTTEPDMNNEMTIPTAVINDIVSGRIQALVLKSDDTVEYKDKFYSENYARFEGSTSATTADNCPRLTVVYQ